MMTEVIANQVFSTPMGFLFHQLKNLQSTMESVVIEEEPKMKAADILRRSGVHTLDIMKDSIAVQQSPREQVEAFLNQHQYQSVIAFTDGAVQESGRGSVAAIVLPLENNVPLLSASHVFSLFTCSLEAEIKAISLAMELAIKYFKKSAHKKNEEKMFVLTDSKQAISCIVNQVDQQYYTSLSKVKAMVKRLSSLGVDVVLSWIPGHQNITYNEKADSMAKEALNQKPCSEMSASFPACKVQLLKQIMSRWQTRWDRSNTGRATHDIVPTVGQQMKQFPDSRCVAISYNRLLLNDTSLRAHQHRMKLSDTNVCDCEQGIEDVHHFLFECTVHDIGQLGRYYCKLSLQSVKTQSVTDVY